MTAPTREYQWSADLVSQLNDLIAAFKFDDSASNFFHTVMGFQPEYLIFNDDFKLDDHYPYCGIEFVMSPHVATEPGIVYRDYKFILHVVIKKTTRGTGDPSVPSAIQYDIEEMIRYKLRVRDQLVNYLCTDVDTRLRTPHGGIRLDVVHEAGEDLVFGGRSEQVGSGDFMGIAIEMTIFKVRETLY